MSNQKKLVRDTFNEDAPSWSDWAYDPDSTYEIYPTGKPRLRQIRRELERFYPGRKLRLLDAGCGTGDVALALAADGHTVQGIDFAPAMIAECVRRYDAAFPARADAHSRFRIGDVETLDFPDSSFDAVYDVGLLEYLERDRPFFDEVCRVLAPGGLFMVECKNRLFNVMSGNRFTAREADDGTLGS
jgi:ubiquinone/menaquinone biosynthesis C-methylase UbiE